MNLSNEQISLQLSIKVPANPGASSVFYFVAAVLVLVHVRVLFLVEIVAVGVVSTAFGTFIRFRVESYWAGSIDFSLSHTFIKSRTKAVSRHIITRNPQRSMLNTLSIV